ncbi:2,3-bisphosphoglycerate-independent phosphoglycerate mutase [Legionella sp. CNM-4043-24]|uniref:2,3-bisphosphoglycerate-independent phosphoglycerate mutase n=1 Tax=Legionella sp. CNM-4043-24 TaxID=3421646 RepID=UPI00403AFC4D
MLNANHYARPSPLVLVILDGWGYDDQSKYNAIAAAKTPQWDEWWQTQEHMLLNASGENVGLPHSQMGNSEVGHMHIGAGRIIPQDFTRINQAMASGEFNTNPLLISCLDELKKNNRTLHVAGLLSPGGVHSHEEHLFAFLALCHQQNVHNLCLHVFLDGRDCPPQSALNSIEKLENCLKSHPVARINSICGRYYAMDRDKRWERIEPVYQLISEGKAAQQYGSAAEAVEACYQNQLYDEFIPPILIGEAQPMQDGDALFFFNFRSDRARQLTQAFIQPDFESFPRPHYSHLSHFISMTKYADNLATECVFPPMTLHKTFGEIIARHGLRQLRIAETEKYAHVTFFFNGGSEQVFEQEKRILVPSPRVATYDLRPEMSAPELTRELIKAIEDQAYDVIICNFANADMVGHTGNFSATVQAIECLDRCLHDIAAALRVSGGALLITADHGNAESMFDDETHQAHTAHTCQPVPLLFVGQGWHFNQSEGSLIDVAPTLLALLNIQQPAEMTGHSLLVRTHANSK